MRLFCAKASSFCFSIKLYITPEESLGLLWNGLLTAVQAGEGEKEVVLDGHRGSRSVLTVVLAPTHIESIVTAKAGEL